MRKKVWIGLGILVFGLGSLWLASRLSFHRLAHPLYLWGLLLVFPLAMLLRRQHQQQKQRLATLYDHPLHHRLGLNQNTPLWLKQLPLLVMFSCIIVALARPQGPLVMSESTTNGIDILVGIDISDSMKATDEGYPNRMGAAKSIVQQLTPFIEGDRVGLFVFSGEAFSLAPFTYDHSTLEDFLSEVSADLLPSETTDLEEALQHALERFEVNPESLKALENPTDEKAGQLLILFTDGENQLGDYSDELETLAKNQIPIITVGVGTTEGARIPIDSLMGRSYKSWQGDYAITKLNPKVLQKIADTTQGSYVPMKKINQLPAALNQARENLHLRQSETSTQQFEERYIYWLLLGLLFWGAWPLVIARLRHSGTTQPRFEGFNRVLRRTLKSKHQSVNPVALALIAFLLSPFLQSAWSWNPLGWRPFWNNSQGEQAYEAQDYEAAQDAFQKGLENNPDSAVLRNNEAHAQYQNKAYEEAIENYKQNLENDQLSPQQKADTLYNLGNSYYRNGQKNSAIQKEQWQEALKSYEEALKLNPKDEQALENLNFVQQQLQQQQQQNGGQNDKQNEQSQNQKSGDQPDAQPSPNPQNQQNQNQQQQDPNQAPQNMPTPEPSPQYFDKDEVDQFLKQQEQDEKRNRGGFHRSRREQNNPKQDPQGDPWNPAVKNW